MGRQRRAATRALVAVAGVVTTLLAAPSAWAVPNPQRAHDSLAPTVTGGDPVYSAPYRCTATVNVVSGASYYFLTSGRCGGTAANWYADAAGASLVGTTVSSTFPGSDYAIVAYAAGVSHPGTIGAQDVTSAGNATVGERVCMRGAVSGVRCGTVRALNASISYPEGTVFGLIDTNICSQPGDTGAVLYAGTTVLGILSGSIGTCESLFQPILPALSRYGVSVF